MNTAHGEPSDANLPFDLKHLRHPITYHCPDDAGEVTRKAARDGLAKQLAEAIKLVITSSEFKKRNQPDAPFVPRKASDGGGRFRSNGEALGLADWAGDAKELYLCDWPLKWFRLMPSRTLQQDFAVTRLRSEIRPGGNMNRLQNFNVVYGDPLSVRGSDGYGTWDPAPGDSEGGRIIAAGVAYAFANGEIWAIDGKAMRNAKSANYIPLNEADWIRLLAEYTEFLQQLKVVEFPCRWIAGMEDLKGRGLFLRQNQYRPLGSCTLDRIEVSGSHSPGDDPAKSLEPFFAKVFDACGLSRITE